ncbi:unnamed protein product [Lupinus luteus]|uniref:NUP210 Ig-like domain-containing protein n=1 Tax=Lupinus luteus TaxID=3873 RepID=A0AAV1Y3Q6_LUPLU
MTMKAANGAFFYRCDAFNYLIKWKAGSESFVIVNRTHDLETVPSTKLHSSIEGFPCSCTYICASNPGQAVIRAILSKEYHQYSHGPVVLKASLHIAACLPLIFRQAGDGNQFGGYWLDLALAESSSLEEIYLVPGTNLDVLLVGGPERWGKGVEFIETVEVLDETDTLVEDGVLVQWKLLFKRGNLVGNDHPLPSVSEAWLSVTCSIPSSIVLIADESVNEREVIRAAAHAHRYVLTNCQLVDTFRE